MAREEVLGRVRNALGRAEGGACPSPPPVRFSKTPEFDRTARFREALQALGGTVIEVVSQAEARAAIEAMVQGRESEFGVNEANYALADTGTLVFLGGSRLVSLLPPRHIAIIERDRILASLDELLRMAPHPAELASAMTLVTGPSRTADIEMRLVRGVHGPGEITVIVAGK